MPTPEAEVLSVNEAFYAAFSRRDFQAMEALWSSRPEIACVHPGWDALVGRRVIDVSPGEMYFASLERYFASPRPGVPVAYRTIGRGRSIAPIAAEIQTRLRFDLPRL